ncbi:MAG: NADH-quinone oxidoreductase subunit N [Phycisphaerae bacterium]
MNLILASIWLPDAAILRFVAPEIALIAAIALLLIAPLLLGRGARTASGIAVAGALAALLLGWATLGAVDGRPTELFAAPINAAGDPGAGVLVSDSLSAFFRIFIAVGLLAIIAVWGFTDAADERHPVEFFVLLLSSAVGMMLMSGVVNLLLMVIAIELASLPSYALAAFDRRRRDGAEAGLKYVMFGAVCSGFSLYGISLLFGLFGTLHVPTLVDRIIDASLSPATGVLVVVALVALFAGIGFKISAVPFHSWCPDVFQGASLPIATWLSFSSKGAGVVLLLRLVRITAERCAGDEFLLGAISYGVAAFAIITCTFANLAAFGQSNVRRLLAYSSIAHAGYMLAAGAIVLGAGRGGDAALSAVVQYLAVYLLMNLGAFVCLGLVAADSESEELSAFTGLGWRDGGAALSMTVCLVSLIGLPPLGGFIAKWWLIYGLGQAATGAPMHGGASATVLWVLIFAIVVNTAISLFYYARVIRQMYLRGDDTQAGALRAPIAGRLMLHVCALLIVLGGTFLVPEMKHRADAVVRGLTATADVRSAAGERAAPVRDRIFVGMSEKSGK